MYETVTNNKILLLHYYFTPAYMYIRVHVLSFVYIHVHVLSYVYIHVYVLSYYCRNAPPIPT